MVVTRKASNPAPVPSRTNTSQNRPPQLRDNPNALAHDILDPFARRNGPIPPQFADNVQYAVRCSTHGDQVLMLLSAEADKVDDDSAASGVRASQPVQTQAEAKEKAGPGTSSLAASIAWR